MLEVVGTVGTVIIAAVVLYVNRNEIAKLWRGVKPWVEAKIHRKKFDPTGTWIVGYNHITPRADGDWIHIATSRGMVECPIVELKPQLEVPKEIAKKSRKKPQYEKEWTDDDGQEWYTVNVKDLGTVSDEFLTLPTKRLQRNSG